jgi:hypothetical protein
MKPAQQIPNKPNGVPRVHLPECDCFLGRLNEICNGTADGLAAAPEYVTWWRGQNGLPPLGITKAEWNVTQRSRGLGDVIAKVTHYTGIAAVANAVSTVTGQPCGCGQRQEAMNNAMPFGRP